MIMRKLGPSGNPQNTPAGHRGLSAALRETESPKADSRARCSSGWSVAVPARSRKTHNSQPSKLMSEENIEQLRLALEAKRAELVASRRKVEGIAIERASDSIDQLVCANERDLAVDTLNREAILLCQVSEALQRIAAGDYGVCLQCDGPISTRRLTALPWAALCLRCQEAADNQHETKMAASVSRLLSHAA
jgi:DnaK suppressor protein